MSQRIDKILVSENFAQTRNQAQQLIKNGVVFYKDEKVLKSSFLVTQIDLVDVRGEIEYVGRGGLKIKGACEEFQVEFDGKVIADIGASTGGFTDFSLKNGAVKVYAIDVGHDQLAQKLREDVRVDNREGINIRYPLELDQLVDLAVVDLSYISLKLTLTTIMSLLKPTGQALCLIKPQFEIGKDRLGKSGVVKDQAEHLSVLLSIYEWAQNQGFYIEKVCASPIEGKTGNREFFYLFNKKLASHQIGQRELEKVSLKERVL